MQGHVCAYIYSYCTSEIDTSQTLAQQFSNLFSHVLPLEAKQKKTDTHTHTFFNQLLIIGQATILINKGFNFREMKVSIIALFIFLT